VFCGVDKGLSRLRAETFAVGFLGAVIDEVDELSRVEDQHHQEHTGQEADVVSTIEDVPRSLSEGCLCFDWSWIGDVEDVDYEQTRGSNDQEEDQPQDELRQDTNDLQRTTSLLARDRLLTHRKPIHSVDHRQKE